MFAFHVGLIVPAPPESRGESALDQVAADKQQRPK
jgi:hypothetical protein